MRFLNADPIGFSGGSNWFAYADGNPISLSDPFGLCAGTLRDGTQVNADGSWKMNSHNVGVFFSSLGNTVTSGEVWERNLKNAASDPANWMAGFGMGGVANVIRSSTDNVAAAAANTIDSAAVRFSQSSISRNFSAGGTIDDLAAGLRNGSVNPTSIPPVRLVERGGSMSTLDNRRLWSFQQAEVPIPYRMATPQEAAAEAWKFTTTNGGTSIRVRGQ